MQFKKLMPAILWAFFIGILCAIPGKDLPTISWLEIISFDKFVHASLFFVLQIFCLKPYYLDFKQKNIFYITSIICIGYGGLLELCQGYFFIDRSADILDFAANIFGVITASLLFWFKPEKINLLLTNFRL